MLPRNPPQGLPWDVPGVTKWPLLKGKRGNEQDGYPVNVVGLDVCSPSEERE